MLNNNEEYLTPAQLAQRLKLNVLTIYTYIRNKKLRALKFGRSYRISQTDFEHFLMISETSI